MRVAWTTVRRSSARVSESRPKPASRDQSRMYIEGAYCAWIPASRSRARGSRSRRRDSRNCRSSSARFSSRWVRTRSAPMATSRDATAAPRAAQPLRLEQHLYGAVLLLLEHLVAARALVERQLVGGEPLHAQRVA